MRVLYNFMSLKVEKIIKECLEYRGYSVNEALKFIEILKGVSSVDATPYSSIKFCLLANISETENGKNCFILNKPKDEGNKLGHWGELYYHEGMSMVDGKHIRVFDDEEGAYRFAETWKCHPWWPTKNRAYSIVKVSVETTTYQTYILSTRDT